MNTKVKQILLYLPLFFLALLLCFAFMQNPFIQIYSWDSSVYQYIGKIINDGFMPYKDIFDHKGPITYLWFAMGYLFHPMTGVWFLELIWLFLAFIIAFKMAEKYTSKTVILSILFATFSITPVMDAVGNTESFSLLPIFFCLYSFDNYITKKNISKQQLLILGFFCALLALVKPTYLLIPFPLFVFIFSDLLYQKKIKTLFIFIKYGFIGFAFPFFLTLYWLYRNDALNDFYKSYIVFNLDYAKNFNNLSLGKSFVLFSARPENFLLLLSFALFLFQKKSFTDLNRKSFVCLFIIYFVYLIHLILLRNPHKHYLLILYPIIFLLLIKTFSQINYKITISFSFLLFAIINFYIFCIQIKSNIYLFSHEILQQKLAAEYILKNLEKDEKFASLTGSFCSIYLYANRLSTSKYPFLSIFYELIPEEIKKDFKNNPPQMVVLPKGAQSSTLIDMNNYSLVYQNNLYDIRINTKNPPKVFKK